MSQILILEDDVELALQWQSALRLEGYGVLVAHGAKDALNLFDRNAIDLCIVDLLVRKDGTLTTDGGTIFLGRLKLRLLDSKDRKVKIIGVSGVTATPTGIHPEPYFMTFGADRFLGKPFRDSDLLDEVRELIG